MEALKFSPTYVGDSSLVVVFSTGTGAGADTGTFYNVAIRDISTSGNNIVGWVWANSIEVVEPNSPAMAGDSPASTTIVNADLQLPSDFSGQSASLRRAYISLDAAGAGATRTGAVSSASMTPLSTC